MLVYRPSEEILKYKGYRVCIHSDEPTEDANKFERIALELRVLITSALQDKLKI